MSGGNDDLAARVTAMGARLTELESIESLRRLQYTYGYLLDKRMWDQIVDLFTDDGSFRVGRRGTYRGREQLRHIFVDILGTGTTGPYPKSVHNHMQSQGVVTVGDEGDHANGRWRAFVQAGAKGRAVWAEGVYECEYRRVDGIWRISSLVWIPTFYAPFVGFEDAWFESSPPSDEFPPDEPAPPFDPEIEHPIVPFHYPHPVTGEPLHIGRT